MHFLGDSAPSYGRKLRKVLANTAKLSFTETRHFPISIHRQVSRLHDRISPNTIDWKYVFKPLYSSAHANVNTWIQQIPRLREKVQPGYDEKKA